MLFKTPSIVHGNTDRSYLNRRQNRRAAKAALKTIGLRYHYPMAHYCLGVALHRMGDIDRAVQALEVAISQNPNFAEAHERLGQIYHRRIGDIDKAEEHQRLAAEIREENLQRQPDHQEASLPQQVPVDIQETPPKVPDVEPAEPQQPAAAGNRVPRIGQAPMPPYELQPLTSGDAFVTVVTGLPRSGTSMMMQMRQLLSRQQIPTLVIPYASAIEKPSEVATQVAEFLGSKVDAQAMAAAIDPALYRQRREGHSSLSDAV